VKFSNLRIKELGKIRDGPSKKGGEVGGKSKKNVSQQPLEGFFGGAQSRNHDSRRGVLAIQEGDPRA